VQEHRIEDGQEDGFAGERWWSTGIGGASGVVASSQRVDHFFLRQGTTLDDLAWNGCSLKGELGFADLLCF